MPRYLEVEDWKQWSRNDLPTVDNTLIEDAILASEQSLDDACDRRFILAVAPATARLFVPFAGNSIVFIDDCTSVTAVSDDGTAVVSTDYQLEPVGGRARSGMTVPYTRIRRLDGGWWNVNQGKATVSVTAVWGWAAIPYRIREACKVLTKAHIDGRDIRAGIAGFSPDGFAVSEREAKVVRDAIRDYSRRHSLVG